MIFQTMDQLQNDEYRNYNTHQIDLLYHCDYLFLFNYNIGNFFCTEIHYDNMGRLLDRRDHLRHGNASIYNDE